MGLQVENPRATSRELSAMYLAETGRRIEPTYFRLVLKRHGIVLTHGRRGERSVRKFDYVKIRDIYAANPEKTGRCLAAMYELETGVKISMWHLWRVLHTKWNITSRYRRHAGGSTQLELTVSQDLREAFLAAAEARNKTVSDLGDSILSSWLDLNKPKQAFNS